MNPASVISIPRVESTPLKIGNNLPLTFICGPCQLESRAHALETAEFLRDVFKRAGAGFIVREDSQGFVDVAHYDTKEALDSAWSRIQADDQEVYAEVDDEEPDD